VTFAGINYWAVVVAAVVGWGFGVVWYMALARRWMGAHRFTSEQMRAHHGKAPAPNRTSSR
jgi:hypothetical protein